MLSSPVFRREKTCSKYKNLVQIKDAGLQPLKYLTKLQNADFNIAWLMKHGGILTPLLLDGCTPTLPGSSLSSIAKDIGEKYENTHDDKLSQT